MKYRARSLVVCIAFDNNSTAYPVLFQRIQGLKTSPVKQSGTSCNSAFGEVTFHVHLYDGQGSRQVEF